MPFQDLSNELVARITSEPTLTVIPLTGVVLGRFRRAETTLEALPPCTVTTTEQPENAVETTASLTIKAPGTLSKLLHTLQNHEEHICGCSESQRRSRPEQLEFHPFVHYACAGDWLCLLHGGDALYLLRPEMIGQLKLVSVLNRQYEEIVMETLGISTAGKEKDSRSNVWPMLETKIPLA